MVFSLRGLEFLLLMIFCLILILGTGYIMARTQHGVSLYDGSRVSHETWQTDSICVSEIPASERQD